MLDLGRSFASTMNVLDAMAQRASVIAHNVANQNTPGFKRFELVFESELRRAHGSGRDAAEVRPTVQRDMSGEPGVNNVEPSEELADLEKVRLIYDLFSRRAAGQLAQLNRAILGR